MQTTSMKLLVMATAIACLVATVGAKTTAWTGAVDGNWSNSGNWTNGIPATGDTLVWDAAVSTANKISTNDMVGLSIAKIDYQNAPDGVVLIGNGLTLSNAQPLTSPIGPSTNITINLDLVLPATTTFPDGNGYAYAVLNGVLSGAGTSLTMNRTSANGLYAFNGLNTFSTNVILGAGNGIGNYIVNTLKNIGQAQSLGTGSLVQFGNVNISDRGNLYYTGGTTSTDKGFQIGATDPDPASGGVFANGSGALTWTGSQTLATTVSTRTFTLGGFNTDANTWTSAIGDNTGGGKVALAKAGRGSWVLKGANSFTGGVTVTSGTLTLDYATNPTVVSSTNTLDLGGGTLEFKANSSGASAQTLGNVTASTDTGLSTVRVNQNGGTGMAVTLGTVGTTAGKSAVLFDLNGSGASSVTIGTAITPDSGTQGRVIIRTNGYDFAVNNGAANALYARSATATFGAANGNAALDYVFANTGSIGSGASGAAISAQSLRIAPTLNSQTMTISNVGAYAGGGAAGLIVDGGGVLYDGGANDFNIAAAAGVNGVSIRTGNNSNGSVLHHMGTGKLTLGDRVYLGYAGSSPGNGAASPLGLFGSGLIDWQGGVNSINGGALTIHGATVRISGAIDPVKLDTTATGKGSMNIALTGGGVIEAVNSDITRNVGTGDGTVQWTGDGGFSAYNGNRAVNLASGAALTWGSSGFVPSENALVLSSSYSDSMIDFQNALNLGGLQRVVRVANGSAAVDARLSGVLSSGLTGGLVKEGDGTLELTGTNTYAGATWVNAGTLRLGNGGTAGALSPSSAIRVSAGATLVVNRSDSVTQGVHFSAAAITGAGGFTQAGSGTTVLNAANSYTGPTTVSNGTLRVNGNQSGATGAVSVASGATLGGSGAIGGAVTIANSATALLYPNHAFAGGTLTCKSNVTFAGSSAVAKFDLSANAGFGNDKVVLTNNATLTCGGATVTINATGTLALADYTLFDVGSGGTVSGSLAATPVWTGTAPVNSNSYSIALDGTGKQVLLKYASGTPPSVSPDTAATFVSTPVTITVTTNDTDFTPPIASVLSNLLWAGSTAVIQNSTNILYTPASGSNGVDQFQYVVTNAVGSVTGTVTVTVTLPPPMAGSDVSITTVGSPLTIHVTTNDTYFLPPIASVLSNQLWAGSTVDIVGSTNLFYTPATGSNGTDHFQYVITNASGVSATGSVSVTVVALPTANDDTALTLQGVPVTIPVTTNDVNFVPPIASVLSNLLWMGSTVSISSGTNLLYTPAASSNGVDQFRYVITNAYGHSATGTVMVTVNFPPPTAGNDSARTPVGQSITINATTNDSNFMPPIYRVLSNLLWAGSTVAISGNTNLLYTPAANSNGVDQFQYVITNAVGSATGTVSVTVPAPGTNTWDGAAGAGNANWSQDNWYGGGRADGGPFNGDALRWGSGSTANKISTNDIVGLSVAGISFQGAPTGIVLNGNKLTLTGSISDGGAGNSPTINLPLELNVATESLTGGTGAGILTINGDISETGGSRAVYGQTGATALYGANAFSGNIILGVAGDVTWYINTLASTNTAQSLGKGALIQFGHSVGNGTVIHNGSGGSTDKRFQIGRDAASYVYGGVVVNNGSGAVVWSGAQTKAGLNNQLLTFTLGGSNAGNNEWQSVITNNSASGLIGITKTNAGKWILSGNNRYSGPTTVAEGTLQINGNQSGATGAVTVAGSAALGGSGTLGGPVTIANSATAHLYPNHAFAGGTLTCASSVTFAGSSAVAKFDLSGNAVSGNDKVVLQNQTLTCGGATVAINSTGTLATADYTLFDVGTGGSIGGTFFVATPVWIGTAPANSNSYSVALDWTGKQVLLKYTSGAVPVAGADVASTFTNVPVTISVTTNDTDFGPPIYQVVSNQLWAGSTVSISGGTNLLYTPATGSNGVDQFQYVITNITGSATGSVTVTVAFPPPTAGNDTAATIVNGAITINVTTNDSNFSPPIASVTPLTWPGSTVSVAGGTNVHYTPAANSNGTDSFQYVITNASGAATGTVTVTVTVPTLRTWDGGGGDDKWSTGANWDNDAAPFFPVALTFAGSTRLTPSNDYVSVTNNGITFGDTAGAFTLGGNALTLGGNITNLSTACQTIAIDMALAAVRTVAGTGGAVTVLSGNLGGNGGVSLARISGTNNAALTLSGNNSYTNATTVAANTVLNINHANALGSGALTISGAGSIDNTSGGAITITNNVSLNANVTFAGTTNLAINGTLTLGNNRTVYVNGNTLTLAKVDASATTHVLTKDSAGTLAITGAAGASYQGGLTINAGTLILGDKNAAGSGRVTLNGGTLQASTDLSGGNAMLNNASLNNNSTVSGAHNITFTGAFTIAGSMGLTSSLDAGKTLTFTGSVTNSSTNNVSFSISGTGNTTFGGAISDGNATPLRLQINSTGVTTFSGTNTYSGTTTINGGILRVVGQTGTASGTGTNAVAFGPSGGTLGGNGRVGGVITIANSTAAMLYPNNNFSGGTLTCASNVTFAGSNARAKFDLSASASSGNDNVVLENAILSCGGARVVINSTGTLATADYTLFDVGASGTISSNFVATPLWTGTAPANSNRYVIAQNSTNVYLHCLPLPTAADDSAVTTMGTPVTINATTNDANFNPPIAQVVSNLLWAGSTVSISGGTNLLYTPASGSNGLDQFQYVITNAFGPATGTVTVTVNSAPPTAGNDSAGTSAGNPVTIPVTTNDANFLPPIGSVLSPLWPGSTAVVQNNTNILYTPATGSNGVDQFQYVITNAFGSATGTVSVTVSPPAGPTAGNDSATTSAGNPVTIPVTTNDTSFLPPIGSVLSPLWPGSTAVVQNDTNILYTPAAGSNGVDQFQYVITNAVGSATGTVTVTVVAPVAYWTGVNGGYWSDVSGYNWSLTAGSPGTPCIPVNGFTLEWRGSFGINKVSTNDLGSLTTVAAINMNNGNPDGVVLNGTNKLAVTGRDFVNGSGSGTNTINLPLDLTYASGAPILYGATGSGLLTLNGVITGTNGMFLSGGNAALYGANAFSGNFSLSSGTLYINALANTNTAQSLGEGASIQFGHNSGIGTLIYNGAGGSTDRRFQISRSLSTATGSGGVINNGSGAVVWSGTQTKATANTNALIFTLGGTNTADNTWQSVIDNNSAAGLIGITKIDSGKWILSGNNLYDGGTTISNGTLLINGNQSGATGAVTVAGGTLGGTGTVGGSVSVAAGGTLEPGSSGIGTLTVTNAVTLAEGAVYRWEYQNGAGDLVTLKGVNGTLMLPSVATVQVSRVSGNPPVPATLFTANALDGATDLSGWVITGLLEGQVRRQGTSVFLAIPQGTVFRFR